MKDYKKASEYLKKYLLSNPKHPNIYSHLCKVLFIIDAYEDIDEACTKADVYRIKKIPYKLWVTALYRLQRFNRAHRIALQALSMNGRNHEMWYLLGRIVNKCGYYKEAMLCYDKALKFCKNYEKARKQFDKIFQNSKNLLMEKERDESFTILDEPIIPNSFSVKSRNCEEILCIII